MKDFITGRIKSVEYAFKGFVILITTEHAIITQLFGAIVLVILGFVFDITRVEWMIQFIIIAIILGVESLNTTIEKLCDFIHKEHHKEIGIIKDVSAGAVFITVLFSKIALIILYLPYFLNL